MQREELTIVGMGYVGMSAALALADDGFRVTCVGQVDPETSSRDTRSTALFPESVDLLESLDIWTSVQDHARPLKGIRVVDETGTLFKAPEVTFRAEECGLEALAINVPNQALYKALAQKLVRTIPEADRHNISLSNAIRSGDQTRLEFEDGGELEARRVVAADGRNSKLRATADIGVREWRYNQTAIACQIEHAAPHHDVSTEFHRPAGPLTAVPGPPNGSTHTSHIVWIEKPEMAGRLMAMTEPEFRTTLDRALQGLLGIVHHTGKRGAFPIKGQTARRFAAAGTFLVGETAHVIPPIGAQGMNLGFRDVTGLRQVLQADDGTRDPAHIERLYNEDRKNDVFIRTTAVDLLNRSLTTPYWPAQAMRGAGLHLLNTIPALKRAVIRAGFGN